ncbi:MAG: hypothetical protein AB8F74_19130 [Saprospiraceae bacterium]
MKIKALLFAVLFISQLTPIKAQLKKGDFFSGSSASTQFSFDAPSNVRQFQHQLNLNSRWMVSKKIMVGGGLSLDRGSAVNTAYFFDITSGVTILSPYFSYTANAEVRAYFSTSRIATYTYCSGSYSRINYRENYYYDLTTGEEINGITISSPLNKETQRVVDLGFGLDFFITPNVVLETRLGWNIYKKGDFNLLTDEARELQLNSGFALLFKRGDERPKQPLLDRYLKQGNVRSQGSLSYKKPIPNERKSHHVSMYTETSYFISNRTEAIGKLGLSFSRQTISLARGPESTISSSPLRMGVGLRHHFKLKHSLFLAPTAAVDLSSFRRNNTTSYSRQLTIPVSLELIYFKNQSRYFLGSTYRHTSISNYDLWSKEKHHSYNAYLGLDYFFRPSIYLRGQLTTFLFTDAVEWETDLPKLKDNLRRMNLSFTFGFMIGS